MVDLVGTHFELYRQMKVKIGPAIIESLSTEERDKKLKLAMMTSRELHPALISPEAEYKVGVFYWWQRGASLSAAASYVTPPACKNFQECRCESYSSFKACNMHFKDLAHLHDDPAALWAFSGV